jgi:signal transduction histidine kinase
VRLDEIAGPVLDAHQELAARHGVTLRRDLAEQVVPGDPVLLERLIANLVSNAITYNHAGGWVAVTVADEPAITVAHSGTVRAYPNPEGGLTVQVVLPTG